MVIYSGFTYWKWWFSIVMFVVYQRVPPNLLLYDSFWMYICFPGSYCNFEAYRTHTFKGSNGQTHHLRLFGTHRLTGDLLYSSYGVWKSGVHVFYPYAAIRQSITLCIPLLQWLVVWNIFLFFPSYWECHHPNCYSLHDFSEGWSTTNQRWDLWRRDIDAVDAILQQIRRRFAWRWEHVGNMSKL